MARRHPGLFSSHTSGVHLFVASHDGPNVESCRNKKEPTKMKQAIRCGVAALIGVMILPAWALSQDSNKTQLTFTKDIAPIFQEKCQSCHRADSIAPMSLDSYEETRPWAQAIKSRVSARQMPPWHIDKHAGIQDFKNDRSLSDSQIETIVHWVDAGAPKGDAKDMPAAKVW